MPQGEGVRLCGGCGKLVYDFRQAKDTEIVRMRAEAPGPVCGIYTQRQLRRGGVVPPRPSRWRTAAAATGVSLASVSVMPTVQAQVPPVDTVQTVLDGAPESPRRSLLVGHVRAGDTGLPGVNVLVRETSDGPLAYPTGAATDLDGRFELDLSPLDTTGAETARVEFHYIGYEPIWVDVPLGQAIRDRVYVLTPQSGLEDLAFYAEAPEPWSLWGWLRSTLGF